MGGKDVPQDVETLKSIIDQSEQIVFFTGAGISVASGIPDFRSIGGLYDTVAKHGYEPEYLLSSDYLQQDPEGFIDFCYQYLLHADKAPNIVHRWIAELEENQQSLGVITQNIDGLHSDAGNKHVDELHGTLNRFYCMNCNEQYTKAYVLEHQLRHCETCGGYIRPDIVLYGEMLDQATILSALQKIQQADTMIVLGSSLVVQPMTGLISNFEGQNLVIINKDVTPYDRNADLVIHDDMVSVVETLQQLD